MCVVSEMDVADCVWYYEAVYRLNILCHEVDVAKRI